MIAGLVAGDHVVHRPVHLGGVRSRYRLRAEP